MAVQPPANPVPVQSGDDGSIPAISLFVSSPGDVLPERKAVARVVDRINDEQRGLLQIKVIRWEEDGYFGAHATFQAQILETRACNLVVCVFWRRLGSELPPDFPDRMKDGKPFPSGTVYELMTALEAREQIKMPDVWVYKKTQQVSEAIPSAAEMAKRQRQWQALEDFWTNFFVNSQGQFTAAYNSFETVDGFEATFERQLRAWLRDKGLLQTRPSWPIAQRGSPFRGLAAFDVEHERIMFGRGRLSEAAVESVQRGIVSKDGFLLLIGESGSGKSSLARAGILPRVMRLLGEAADRSDVWRLARVTIAADQSPFDLLANALFQSEPMALPELAQSDFATPMALAGVMRQAGAVAVAPIVRALGRVANAFHAREKLERPAVARLVVLLDQLESLFVLSKAEQDNFAALIRGLVETGAVVAVATMRSDHYEAYCRVDDLRALKAAGTTIDVPMPGQEALADIVRHPAKAAGLSYGVDKESGQPLDDTLIKAAAGRDALPLLQFTLEKLYEAMEARLNARGVVLGGAKAEDLVLQPEVYVKLGKLEGAIGLVAAGAYDDLDSDAKACLPQLVRALVRRDDKSTISEPAVERDVVTSDPMRRLVEALLSRRILVTGARVLDNHESRVTIRFAHEAVIRGWPAVRDCIAADDRFFRVRADVARAEGVWRDNEYPDDRLIPPGQPLIEAAGLIRDFRPALPASIIAYVEASIARERARRSGKRRLIAAMGGISLIALAGLIYAGISEQTYFVAVSHEVMDAISPKELTAAQEASVPAGRNFQECIDCPVMLVIPAGAFKMGAPASEARDVDPAHFAESVAGDPAAYSDETPVHDVTIASPFAVSKDDITFAEWDVCYLLGGCNSYLSDEGWGRGTRPVVNVEWDDAKQYVAWLSRKTGKRYRLLTEAEWEYGARAGTATATISITPRPSVQRRCLPPIAAGTSCAAAHGTITP